MRPFAIDSGRVTMRVITILGGSAVGGHTLIESIGSAGCDFVNGVGGNYNLTAPRSW